MLGQKKKIEITKQLATINHIISSENISLQNWLKILDSITEIAYLTGGEKMHTDVRALSEEMAIRSCQ